MDVDQFQALVELGSGVTESKRQTITCYKWRWIPQHFDQILASTACALLGYVNHLDKAMPRMRIAHCPRWSAAVLLVICRAG